MKKKTKKRSWLYYFYKENVMYIWVVVGIIVVSGFSIGMSIGKLTENNSLVLDNNNVKNNTINHSNISNEQISMNNNNNSQIDTNKQINSQVDTEKITPINNSNKENNGKNSNENLIPSIQTNSEDIEKQTNVAEEKLEFIMPIQGEVSRDFTTDTLVFSNTLQAWISHEGIDILADLATPVKVIEKGEVIEVKNDPRYGYIIIVDHGQGYQSIYCNLSTVDMVHVGKKVEKGQVISGVGNTALFEIKDNSHLHFELTKDGKNVNPTEYIK